MAAYGTLIPVNLITGFLGSGKTTLLQRLLRSPSLADTAVLINELGEVGLDHLLLDVVDTETVVLQSGCVCCTIRDDLAAAIRGLFSKRERGQVPRFDRLVIETTGLADPAPIVATLMAEPVVRHHFRLGSILTTVDSVNGARQLAEHPESVKQAAIADRLVLTKTDLADRARVRDLAARLRALNPSALLIDAQSAALDPEALVARDVYDLATKTAEVQRWLEVEPAGHDRPDPARHDHAIRAFCLSFEGALDWTAFGIWLTMLLHAHGEDVLRVKGILNVAGLSTPVVVHGVQHVVHPPAHLGRWPSAEHRSRIVFIVRGLDQDLIERSLATFNRLAKPAEHAA